MRSEPEPSGEGSQEWGPRDWCASGVGGESFDLAPDPAAVPFSGEATRRSSKRRSGGWGAEGGPRAEEPAGPGPQDDDPERGERPRGRGERRGRRGGRGDAAGRAARESGGPPSEPEADPAARARDICLRLLTGTAKTRKQLADALRKREIPEEVAEQVLSRFEEVGLIDDAAFAAAWVESRHAGRGLARRALAQELRTRGVSGPLVEEAVAQLDPDEEAVTARVLVERKLRSTAGLERQARMRRLVGVLARRGYSQGLAFRVVREVLDEQGESAEELEDWSVGAPPPD